MGATDIYIRRPNKSNFSENNIEVNDKLSMFLQEIEMVLGTPPTTVLGRPELGVGLQSYLHDFNVGESELVQKVNEQISRNCAMAGDFSWKVTVEFYKNGSSDSAIIDIVVEEDNLVRLVVN